MIIVGLTGGIASGKTTISKFLKKNRIAVHESDAVVKKLYSKPNQALVNCLKKLNLLDPSNKKINKTLIREKIFNNKTKKTKLENFIHKEVKKSRNKFLKKNIQKKTKIVVLDIPLLFEAKLEHVCDFIIFLYLPHKQKLSRALQRKGMTKKILLKIIKNQKKDSYKKTNSDFVINTSKRKQQSFNMILNIISTIIKKNA